jgi:hypothetical protein
MKIDLNLIKEARETVDWLLSFPEKLVSTVMAPRETWLGRRERIRKLKEIVEVREIIKAIQDVYWTKGNLSKQIQQIQSVKTPENAAIIRELFEAVAGGLAEIRAVLKEASLSNTSLSTEAAIFLAKTEAVYDRLAALPDEGLLNDEAIVEIAGIVQLMIRQASVVLKQLDDYRLLLDHTHGQ